jgi:hypothetical protein
MLSIYFNFKVFLNFESRCPALGIWVAFLKQPTLPGEAPQHFLGSSKNATQTPKAKKALSNEIAPNHEFI